MGKREEVAEEQVADDVTGRPSARLRMEALKVRAAVWDDRGKYTHQSDAAEQLGLPRDHPDTWRLTMAEVGLLDQYEAELAERKARK